MTDLQVVLVDRRHARACDAWNVSPPHDCTCGLIPKPNPLVSAYSDPFLDICIHGIRGVRWLAGVGRRSPSCAACIA